MALPKKGLRKITVDGERYAWNATGNDGYISLSISPVEKQGQLLTATLDYHSAVIRKSESANGSRVVTTRQRIAVTPRIIRQVILLAFERGWTPINKASQMNLGAVDALIDLRLPDTQGEAIEEAYEWLKG